MGLAIGKLLPKWATVGPLPKSFQVVKGSSTQCNRTEHCCGISTVAGPTVVAQAPGLVPNQLVQAGWISKTFFRWAKEKCMSLKPTALLCFTSISDGKPVSVPGVRLGKWVPVGPTSVRSCRRVMVSSWLSRTMENYFGTNTTDYSVRLR